MIYSRPSTSFEATASGFPSGLTGTIGIRITDGAGGTSVQRRTSGIGEYPTGSGIYYATITAPSVSGQYQVVWDTGGASPQYAVDELTVTYSGSPVEPVISNNYYSAPSLVRAELDYTEQQLSDAAAEKIITEAEDAVDALLGGWVPDSSTGRKISEGDVMAWQWGKLVRATTILAAKLVLEPDLLEGQQWRSVSGPDFSFSGPLSGRFPTRVIDLLNDSGLRKMIGQAHTASQTRAVDREADLWED